MVLRRVTGVFTVAQDLRGFLRKHRGGQEETSSGEIRSLTGREDREGKTGDRGVLPEGPPVKRLQDRRGQDPSCPDRRGHMGILGGFRWSSPSDDDKEGSDRREDHREVDM